MGLATQFENPVVIVGHVSYHDSVPGVIRIDAVGADGFDARFDEWEDHGDGVHDREIFPYLVLEAGTHLKPCKNYWDSECNVIIKAGVFEQTGNTGTAQHVAFDEALPGRPHLFLTLQTRNGGEVIEVRGENVTESGFDSVIYQQKLSLGSSDVAEMVGYFAMWSPDGSGEMNIGGDYKPYVLQKEEVDQRWMPTASTAIKIEEENSDGSGILHTLEPLDIMALGEFVFAQDSTSLEKETAGLRQKPAEYTELMEWGTITGVTDSWVTIPLTREYTEPVVVAYRGKPNEELLNVLGVVRIQNFTGDSFHARFQLWDYLEAGGSYNAERINYLVAESGNHLLGGLGVRAGKLESDKLLEDGGFDAVSFVPGFDPFHQPPAVFSSVMSFREPIPRLTRIDRLTPDGFDISQQEQEANISAGRVRNTEMLGWVAIEKGVDNIADNNGGRPVDAWFLFANDEDADYAYRVGVDRRMAVVLAHLNTVNDIDVANSRVGAVSDTSVSVRVQEEQSFDGELMHGGEEIGVIVLQ